MFPASDATRVHVPDATMVMLRPDVVHTDEVEDVMTGVTPEDADAVTENADADQVRGPGFVNKIVLDNF